MQKKGYLFAIASLILFTILALFVTFTKTPLGRILQIPVAQTVDSKSGPADTAAKKGPQPVAVKPVQPPPQELKKMDWPKPQEIRGVYTTGWIAGSGKWFPRLIDFINATEVNALVVDIKDDTGTLSFMADVPLAKTTQSAVKMIADPVKMMRILKEQNIFPIARIVVFKDPFMAKAKPEWAVKDSEGGLWKDRKGLNWIDPYNKLYWDYIVDIAKEAIRLGFQEIQFDYVRFTSDGNTKRCVYPFSNEQAPEDLIREFLKYAKDKLAVYQVPTAADIFGLTTSADADLGIGQRFEKIIGNVDVVCPMVYPSHYIPGNFGLKNPNAQPYQTVFQSISDAKKRMEQAGNTTTQLRPWLQDFSLGVHYGKAEIQAQIKAVKDAGINEWIFWNPSCRYNAAKYN
jgi:hypothetical protein